MSEKIAELRELCKAAGDIDAELGDEYEPSGVDGREIVKLTREQFDAILAPTESLPALLAVAEAAEALIHSPEYGRPGDWSLRAGVHNALASLSPDGGK